MGRNNKMIKTNPLVKAYEESCEAMAREVYSKIIMDGEEYTPNADDYYWVADIVGGLCDFGDTMFLSPEDMAIILERDVTYDELRDWQEYNLAHYEEKVEEANHPERAPFINLDSWLMGARPDMLGLKKDEL